MAWLKDCSASARVSFALLHLRTNKLATHAMVYVWTVVKHLWIQLDNFNTYLAFVWSCNRSVEGHVWWHPHGEMDAFLLSSFQIFSKMTTGAQGLLHLTSQCQGSGVDSSKPAIRIKTSSNDMYKHHIANIWGHLMLSAFPIYLATGYMSIRMKGWNGDMNPFQ